jgi:hypothetical protein
VTYIVLVVLSGLCALAMLVVVLSKDKNLLLMLPETKYKTQYQCCSEINSGFHEVRRFLLIIENRLLSSNWSSFALRHDAKSYGIDDGTVSTTWILQDPRGGCTVIY